MIHVSLGKSGSSRARFSEAIKQMIEKGEVEEIQEDPIEARNLNRTINYLFHHGVLKFDRISTKCLIVFDSRGNNSIGVSLNSNSLPGPERQLNIILLLINFILHPYTVVREISRMFYCINLEEKYVNY